MLDPLNVPAVAANETLVRYILHSGHLRRSDRTIKPDAFIPHPRAALSVTRQSMATEAELWSIGEDVASTRSKTLYGRGDFPAAICLTLRLQVDPAPLDTNPNHANITRWPAEKPLQKILAQQIAAVATFVENSGTAPPRTG